MLAIVAAARLPSLWEPRWSHDEGVYTAVAQAMLAGRSLYTQAWDLQQPLVYLWTAEVSAVTQGWHPGAQLVLLAQALFATAAVYLLAAQLGGRPGLSALLFGLATALPLTEGDVLTAEMIGLPLQLFGFWLGSTGGARRALAGGALVAASGLAQPGLLLQALALAWFAVLSGRPLRLAPLAAGASGLLLLAALWLGAAGMLPAYGRLLDQESGYLAWSNGGRELAPIAGLLRVVPIAAGLFGGLSIGLEQRTPAARLLGAWLPLAVLTAVLSPRGFMHYGLLVIAPLSLLLGLWLTPRLFLPVAIGAVLAIQAILFLPRLEMTLLDRWPVPAASYTPFGWTRLPAYYRGWYDHLVGVASWRDYERGFPGDPGLDEEQAAALRVGGRLLVWGDRPWLYPVSGRLAAGRYVAHDSAWRLQRGAAAEELASITNERPEYVVVIEPPDPAVRRQLGRDYDRLRFVHVAGWESYALHSG